MAKQRENGPAPLRVWLVTGALLLAAVLGFALLLRAELQRPHAFDPAACGEPAPADLAWACTVTPQADYYTLDGYAFLPGERFEAVENYVVVYDTAGTGHLRLSTAMVTREEATAAGGDGINYSFGGFTAFVRASALQAPPERYEVCLLYRSNGHDFLYHSGQTLAGGAL